MTCERYQLWMTDAATEALSEWQQVGFKAHVRECSACRSEFERVRALLEAIDRGVEAQVAPEPSPEMMARLRRRIGAEASPSIGSWALWAPATACAAAVILAIAVWLNWPASSKRENFPMLAAPGGSVVALNHTSTGGTGAGTRTASANAMHAVAPARQFVATKRGIERKGEIPEVIVAPGQAEALLQFVAALQNGKLDSAKLLAEQKEAEQPIEIKPLVIPPLENATQADKANSSSAESGTQKDFVTGEPTQGLKP